MKSFRILLAVSLLTGLCACSSGGKDNADLTAGAPGSWEVYDTVFTSVLTPEETELFADATEGLVGVTYEPAAILAVQLVSGTNYAYLAKGTTVSQTPAAGWYVVTVYRDLEGAVSLLSAEQIDIADIKTTEARTEYTLGSWKVDERTVNAAVLPENAHKAFNAAMEDFTGVGFEPIGLLATQPVAGTNYLILAKAQDVSTGAGSLLYAVTVYEDASGSCRIADETSFDLTAYISN